MWNSTRSKISSVEYSTQLASVLIFKVYRSVEMFLLIDFKKKEVLSFRCVCMYYFVREFLSNYWTDFRETCRI